MAKNERRVKRMAVESWPCRGGDRGEAAVRCCESMAVEIFYFLFFIFYFRFLAVCLGYENECGVIHLQ